MNEISNENQLLPLGTYSMGKKKIPCLLDAVGLRHYARAPSSKIPGLLLFFLLMSFNNYGILVIILSRTCQESSGNKFLTLCELSVELFL